MLMNAIKISGVAIALCSGLGAAAAVGPATTTSSSVLYNTLSSYLPESYDQMHRHLVVQLGGFWSSQGKTQNINIEGLEGNSYTISHNNPSNGLFGLGYYVDGIDKDHFQLAYGINGFYLAGTPVKGSIMLEDFLTNFNYNYNTQHIPVYFAAKAVIKSGYEKYNITFDAGIGPNFMRTSKYSETPLTSVSLPADNFTAHNNVAFTAMAGVGLRLNNAFGQVPLECGYRFFYLGEGQLHTNNSLYLNPLKTGNTYANALLCSITV